MVIFMKKTVSLLLASVLLFTTLITALPVAAALNSEHLLAIPLTGYTANAPYWDYVAFESIMPETTKKFVNAEGMMLSSVSTEYNNKDVKQSFALAQALYSTEVASGYELPSDFAVHGSIIVYIKISSANKMYFMATTDYGENWGTTVEIADNANYQFAAVGSGEWTDAKSDESGLIGFSEAFEGYLRLPVDSFVSVDNVSVNFNFLGLMGIRLEGVGGNYGNPIVGPFFVTTSDSSSAEITVPEEYRPAPIPLIPLTDYTLLNSWQYNAALIMPEATKKFVTSDGISLTENYMGEIDLGENPYSSYIYAQANYADDILNSYKLPADFAVKGNFIVYVKTDSANKMAFMARTECPSQWFTTGKIKANAGYEYATIDSSEWITAFADENGTIHFDSAFEGYIKIPVTSMISMDSVPLSFNYLSFIDIRLGGIGGKFGGVTVGPFFVTTSDSSSTEFMIPEEYQPSPLDISSFSFKEARASGYNYSADKIENTDNYRLYIDDSVLSDTTVKYEAGVEKWSYVENADGAEASDGATAFIMTPTIKTYMKNASGLVFYVDFKKANTFSPCLVFDDSNIVMLKPGEKVYLLQEGDDGWNEKVIETGYGDNTSIYGKITFDSEFKGYIKAPFTSFNNDSGFKPVFSGDSISALTSVVLRFKGIGDDAKYGNEVIAGITGYYTTDTAKASIGTITVPNYPDGDANYDWKVTSEDLTSIRKTLLGIGEYTGYKVTILDLIKVKKILAKIT